MLADDVLAVALEFGRVVWGSDVSEQTWSRAARTYLGDGTGVAWDVPAALSAQARFVIDAEIVAPVRASLVRRYGITDPVDFAQRWTRAEALAKLADTPIVTWLQRHGLDVPEASATASADGHLAWLTETRDLGGRDVMITYAAALPPRPSHA